MRISHFITGILLTILSLVCMRLPINAQNASLKSQIQISPPIAYLKVGESYNLKITNNTTEPFSFTLSPNLFNVNTTDRTINPLTGTDLDAARYITIDTANKNTSFVLLAGETIELPITYIEETPSQILAGVLITSTGMPGDTISVGFSAASIIINPEWSVTEVTNISQELFISPRIGVTIPNNTQLGGVSLGRDVQVKAVIKNTTNRILIHPSGELKVYAGGTHIQTESLTQGFPSSIYTNEEFSFDQPFNDSRPFYQRIGMIDYTFAFTIDGKTITKNISILSLPYELLLILIALLVVIIITLRAIRRRRHVYN